MLHNASSSHSFLPHAAYRFPATDWALEKSREKIIDMHGRFPYPFNVKRAYMSHTPSMNKHDQRSGDGLRNFILAHIREGGPVTFARFMEWCLYHPDYGYYSAVVRDGQLSGM